MELIRSIDSSRLPKQGCVLTIGNFDAVHTGHQKILAKLVHRGRELALPVVVMTFDPSPEDFFLKDNLSTRLTTLSSRYCLLRDHHVDVMLALKFNQALAQTTAEIFIEDYLVKRLQVKYLLIGDDFRFGTGRKGNFALLVRLAEKYGYQIEQFETVSHAGTRVSSTYVRELLANGQLDLAEKLLARQYAMLGRVIPGDKRGRQWGFPTLNLAIKHRPAVTGVFAVKVTGAASTPRAGVANLGMRPTVGGMKTLLEVHLFDFSEEIYGRRICVEFFRKIRDERQFDSFDQLKKQIACDVEMARTFFRR